MAKTTKALTATEEVLGKLQPIADALKVGVSELWKIFVKRWLAKGASEMLVAVCITVAAIIKLGESNWVFLPLGVALLIAYDAINLLINPEYFAIADITNRLKDENGKSRTNHY